MNILQVISQWPMDQPPLGHKSPRPGMGRLASCPACPAFYHAPIPMSSRHIPFNILRITVCYRHVLEDCLAVETVRQKEGIRGFLQECNVAGLSSATAFRHYIAGLDAKGNKIDAKEHLSRGGCLMRLTEAWLNTWEQNE